jgi:hypothetical protein
MAPLLIALLVVAVLGGAATAYVWLVYRHRLEALAGTRIVAGMRWREFSQLVVDALHDRGFATPPPDSVAHRGLQTDLVLHREGQIWLLACKQGAEYRITPAVLAEFAKSMRLNNASGGMMATPGKIDAEARRHAGEIELLDGAALWPMLKPLLPESVRTTVASQSHARSVRYTALSLFGALALAVGIAWLMPAPAPTPPPPPAATAAVATPPASAAVPETPVVLAPAPLSETEVREQVRREVSDLPGIDRALWSTRSTLVVFLGDDSGLDHLQAICGVVERYDDLRASRLQLQPAPGSKRPVRFLQCRLY